MAITAGLVWAPPEVSDTPAGTTPWFNICLHWHISQIGYGVFSIQMQTISYMLSDTHVIEVDIWFHPNRKKKTQFVAL